MTVGLRWPRGLAAPAVLSVALLAGCGGSSTSASPTGGPTTAAPSMIATPEIAGVVVVNGLPHTHFLGVNLTYSHVPPLGGDHSPVPLTCAVYTQPVPNENAVHSLEHGAVWLTYLPSVNPASLVALDKIDPSYVVVSPYPSQSAPVIATAWGLQLRVNTVDDPRLRAFVEKYHGGSQGGEKGAVCTGATTSVTPAQANALLAQGPPAGQATPPNPADPTSGS